MGIQVQKQSLTVEEVVELGFSRATIFNKLATGEWQSPETGLRGRNGKPIREVSLESLPEELQAAWIQRQTREAAAVAVVTDDSEVVEEGKTFDLTALLSRYPAELREAFITEVNRLNDLMNRFDQINPKRVRGADGQLVFASGVVALCREAVCTHALIIEREPKRAKEPSPFTLDGWSRRRKVEGLTTFLRAQPKAAQTDKRKAPVSPEAFLWMNANWRNFPTVSHFYKRLQKLAIKHGWHVPSESTVRRFYDDIPAVVRAAVFGTGKDYTSKHKPFVPRSFDDLTALQVLCGDHHVLDVHCWIEATQQLVRLWLTAWQDVRTGLIWGYHLDVVPSSHTIGCAYANGVRAFGAQPFARPQDAFTSYIYTDNGKDYRSRNLNGEIEIHRQASRIDGGLEMLLVEQGVGLANDADLKHLLARPFNGREKPIERTFRDLADWIQNEFFRDGWCGRSTTDRPDSWRELYKRHVKAISKGKSSPFPLDTQIRDAVATWIDDYNTAAHTRTTLADKRIVPLAEFNRLYTTRYEIPAEKLALLLMKPASAAIGKNGVQCLGGTYTHPALSEFKGQKSADGKALQIEIRYTDEDYSTVWLILPDGRICEATRLTRSSVLQPNKETHQTIARLTKHEANLISNFHLLTESHLRGESIEDRAARMMGIEQIEELKVAVGGGGGSAGGGSGDTSGAHIPRVQRLDRLDAKRLRAVEPRRVSVTDVRESAADSTVFDVPDKARVSEFDFDE